MLSKIYSARKREETGFTLIELLIVVIIIGILAAIALPIFIDQSRIAVDTAVASDVHNTALEVQQWRADNPTASAADAKAYVAADGKITHTVNNGYIGLIVRADGSYGVCGYNTNGKKYTGPVASFVFDSTTGRFGYGDGCYSAVTSDPSKNGTVQNSDGSTTTTTDTGGTTTTKTTNSDGSSVTIVTGTDGSSTTTTTTSGGTSTTTTSPAGGSNTTPNAPVYRVDPSPTAAGSPNPRITGGTGIGSSTPTVIDTANPGPSTTTLSSTPSSNPSSSPSTSVPTTVTNGTGTGISTLGTGQNFVYYDDSNHAFGGVATFNAGGQYGFQPAPHSGDIAWATNNGGAGSGVDATQTYDGSKNWYNSFTPNYAQASFGFEFDEATIGTTYSVSFQYKIVGSTSTSNPPRVIRYQPPYQDSNMKDLVADGQWHQISMSITAVDNGGYGLVKFYGQSTGDGTGNGGTYIDNINIFPIS